jgi:hypothetical protein
MDCKDSLYRITGVQLKGNQDKISSRQFWFALFVPIANLFLWAVVFLVGVIIYGVGNIVIPIEQSVKEIVEQKAEKKGK